MSTTDFRFSTQEFPMVSLSRPRLPDLGLFVSVALTATVLSACQDSRVLTDPAVPGTKSPILSNPSFAISDAVHSSGNPHFFFLPPLVDDPAYSGTFEGTLSPVVEICEWTDPACGPIIATFTTSSGPGSETVRVVLEDEHYIVNWHTEDFGLDDGKTYRIRVLVAGTELGFADLDVVMGGNELKNVDTGQFLPLKDGRTLPIKFRIERGAVFVVGGEGGTIQALDGIVEVVIPAGALSAETGITARVIPLSDLPADRVADVGDGTVEPLSGDRDLIDDAVELGPDGLIFAVPVTLTVRYDESMLPATLTEDELALVRSDDGGSVWTEVPESVVDEVANTLTAKIDGFSLFDWLNRIVFNPIVDFLTFRICVVSHLGGPDVCYNSRGDVHMRTPDGLAYDFQGAGEYLFVESADGEVVVQVRMEPWEGSEVASVNTAAAMYVSGDRVGVYLGRSPDLYVNGQPTQMADTTLDLGNGGRVARRVVGTRTDYAVQWPNGFLASATLRGSYLDVGVWTPLELQTSFAGLVGNLNGQAADDIQARDGVTLDFPVLFDELYRLFGDSWRISAGESLFDYESGNSTETFQLLDFPLRQVSTADFNQAVVDAARQSCEDAGIQDPTLLDDCIFDLVVTGDQEFVESAVDSVPPATSVGVVEIVNGGFDLNADGWFWQNIDSQGGWFASGGNPGGNFALNEAGQQGTDPQVCQLVEGLQAGKSYRITGDYASYAPSFGDPAKFDAFAVTVDGAAVLELPRPAPVSTDWTAFSTDVITGVEDPTICFVAERDGDDSSFFIDNIALKGTQNSGPQ